MSFEGEIGEIDLLQRLVDLGRERFTGAIRFENDGIIKIVYFKGGDILSASTNDRGDSIDEILFRAGKVTREHIKQALAKRKESETLGDALLGLGFITRKELTWARRVQVIGIIRSTLEWKTGSWTIVDNYLPKREEGTIFPLAQIILELIVTDSDRPKFEQAMSSGSAVFRRVDGFDEAFNRLGLNEDAEAITGHLDGVRSAADVAGASGKDIFNVYKLLEALRVLRLLERADTLSGSDLNFAGAGLAAGNQFDAHPIDNPGFSLHDEELLSSVLPTLDEPTPQLPSWEVEPDSAVAPPAPSTTPAMRSAWDDPDENSSLPLQGAPTPEPDWGFDEAQIEAARKATSPGGIANPRAGRTMSRPAAKPARSMRGIALIVALLLLAAGGWGAWTWWQGKQAKVDAPVTARNASHPRVVASAQPASGTTGTTASPALAERSLAPGQKRASSAATIPASTASSRPPTGSSAGNSPTMKIAPTVAAPPMANAGSMQASRSAMPAPRIEPAAKQSDVKRAAQPAKSAAQATLAPRQASSTDTPHVERTPAGGATIINGGVKPVTTPSAGGSALESKYEEMGRAFSANPEGNYTVQIELVCETASVTRALQSGGARVWFLPTTFHGRSCYRIFWGRFADHDAALSATKSIPAGLRGSVPVVVKVPRS